MKVTFIHASKALRGNPDILLLPIGLIALASFLQDNKISSEIIHLELEKSLDPKFDLINYLRKNNKQILCFDLHWHYQANKVSRIIRKIKDKIPRSIIIVGGFTASFFVEEILKNFPEIDFIIQGDSEIPLLSLVKALQRKSRNYVTIPNIAWRSKKKTIINKISYTVSQKILDNLKFSNFEVVKNYAKYNKIHLNCPNCLGCNKRCDSIFYYNCGRGCLVNCSFCGGSNISQRILNARKGIKLIGHDSVIKELRSALSYNLITWYTCFDPYPRGNYYIELFKKIRKENINLSLQFECWSLPTKKFINEFIRTFKRNKSEIIISPECGSDSIRKKNKGYFFSNNELIDIIKYASLKGVRMRLFFTAGLPFEKKEDIVRTLSLINFTKKFRNVEIECFPIEFEPASPWPLEAQKYGISSNRRTFMNYYQIHQKKSDIGYETNYFTRKQINNIVQLLRMESNCNKPRSRFLEDLLNTLFAIDYYDFSKIYMRCKSCKNFSNCSSSYIISCQERII